MEERIKNMVQLFESISLFLLLNIIFEKKTNDHFRIFCFLKQHKGKILGHIRQYLESKEVRSM